MPRTLALQDDKCQVPAAAVIGLQNLTGWSQPEAVMLPNRQRAEMGINRTDGSPQGPPFRSGPRCSNHADAWW
jgi:hypothetical protein